MFIILNIRTIQHKTGIQLGTTPHASTLCLPHIVVTTCDQISQALPLHICTQQEIKDGGGNPPGNEVT